MRRKQGSGLTRNEQKALAAALHFRSQGVYRLYGLELYEALGDWEGRHPMNHGTLYRGLRQLEARGFLSSAAEEGTDGRRRVFYQLTAEGRAAALQATVQLAASTAPPGWLDLGMAVRAASSDG